MYIIFFLNEIGMLHLLTTRALHVEGVTSEHTHTHTQQKHNYFKRNDPFFVELFFILINLRFQKFEKGFIVYGILILFKKFHHYS